MSTEALIPQPGDDPMVIQARNGANAAQTAHETALAALAAAKASQASAEADLIKSDATDIAERLAPLIAAVSAAESVVRITAGRLQAADDVYRASLDDAGARVAAVAADAMLEAGKAFVAAARKTMQQQERYFALRAAAISTLPADLKLSQSPWPLDSISGAANAFGAELADWATPPKPKGCPEGHIRVRFLKQPVVGVMGAAGPVPGHMYALGDIAALPLVEQDRDRKDIPGRVLGWINDGICERVEG
ncbi:hypothetical protein [Paramagnetospirillum kuznetsovii]|nr:hypothetical protein [Paramagnetospirillum kuznetsovii]